VQSGTESSKKRPQKRKTSVHFLLHTHKRNKGGSKGQGFQTLTHSLQWGLRREEITTNSHSSGVFRREEILLILTPVGF